MYFFSSNQDRSGIETVKPLCAILANLSVHFLCYVMLFIYLAIYLCIFIYLSFVFIGKYILTYLATYFLHRKEKDFFWIGLYVPRGDILFVQEIHIFIYKHVT